MEQENSNNNESDVSMEKALKSWNSPRIPHVIAAESEEEFSRLGETGEALKRELAFMKYPDFQTYANMPKIKRLLSNDPRRGAEAIFKHEAGHRFCPYDIVTSIILLHNAKKGLEGQEIPYSADQAAKTILNLYTDEVINTNLARNREENIPWLYRELSSNRSERKLWRVYARSMELAWGENILPEGTKLEAEEEEAAQELAGLFEKNWFDRDIWPANIREYARTISRFLEDEQVDSAGISDIAGNIPRELDKKTAAELAKRLAEIGSDGLPTSREALKDFRGILAGYGQGDPIEASVTFYKMLSDSYDVMFALRPFGRPRVNPFQPIKWQPSMGPDKLDVDYSVHVGGRIIPGVNTYSWLTRRREVHGGFEEIVPNLDLYLDSSGSMPNPTEYTSLPVLAGFVASKKAHRKGAYIRATNFSGNGQHTTQESTRDLEKVYKTLVKYFNGGTVFPSDTLLGESDPKQILIITDTFVFNPEQTAEAISTLKRRHRGNNVTVYAISPVENSEYLHNAGAEIVQGTTTDIFRRVIGRADEMYSRRR